MNNQKPAKKWYHERGLLEVHSIFSTIQGEGPHAGKPATFIRLAGCNLQCPFCDTDYTSMSNIITPDLILDKISLLRRNWPTKLVVITGGEPFRQNLTPLVNLLLASGLSIQVETNGTILDPAFPYAAVDIVCSPKSGLLAEGLGAHITHLKYLVKKDTVLDASRGGVPIQLINGSKNKEGIPADFKGSIYLQPLDCKDDFENKLNVDAVVRGCMRYGHTVCLQLHKIINVE